MKSVRRRNFYEFSFNFLFSEFEFFHCGNEFRLAKTFWLDWKLFAPNFFLLSNFDFSIFAAFLLPRLPLRVCVCDVGTKCDNDEWQNAFACEKREFSLTNYDNSLILFTHFSPTKKEKQISLCLKGRRSENVRNFQLSFSPKYHWIEILSSCLIHFFSKNLSFNDSFENFHQKTSVIKIAFPLARISFITQLIIKLEKVLFLTSTIRIDFLLAQSSFAGKFIVFYMK